MKNYVTLLLFFISFNIYSQTTIPKQTIGSVTKDEINLQYYSLDSTANALVLYESGNTTFEVVNDIIIIQTKIYKKIKIFNKEGYNNATFSIPIYNNKSNYEQIIDISAATYNKNQKNFLNKNDIHTEKTNDFWKKVKFTLPNIKDGSVIEVSYTLNSPFKFNLTGWEFQTDIPKLYSEYKASIPGNYVYNRKLSGYLKLKSNISKIKKDCFHIQGYPGYANCEEVTYAMENIPAFIDEDYISSEDNFKAKIKFELSQFLWFDGTKQKYTTTWKDVDKDFRTDKNIGRQLKKTKYFIDKLPGNIISLPSELEKAKAVFNFIQDHFSWNNRHGIFNKANIKKAYESNIGNIAEINLSLINSLKAVGLKSELVLSSTRSNGFPTKLYPVITDFNYVLAKVDIDGKTYLLDASNKFVPFGLLPSKCLNGYGRVMDFKNESYWMDINPEKTSKTQVNANLVLNENGLISGKIRKSSFDHYAITKREEISGESENDLMDKFENQFNNLEVISYNIKNRDEIDKPLIETYEISIDFEDASELFINPFFSESFKKNPFKQEKRLHPVDFSYPRKINSLFVLEIPDNFEIKSLPKPKSFKLKENGGSYNYFIKNNKGVKLMIKSSINIDKAVYYRYEYADLKSLFNEIILAQKTPINLIKV